MTSAGGRTQHRDESGIEERARKPTSQTTFLNPSGSLPLGTRTPRHDKRASPIN
jgi:hypothetical protein